MIPSVERLSRAWQNLPLGSPLWFFESLDSTNELLKQKAEQDAPEGCVVMANAQTAGRGRLGRSWLSLPNLGVYLSVLLRPAWPAIDSGFAATLASLAVARCLQKLGADRITLKWPNDVLADNRKIAGILVEPRIAGNRVAFIVLGIGINVRHEPDSLQGVWNNRATSCKIQGISATVEDVAGTLMPELAAIYTQARKGESDAILADWLNLSGTAN